MTEFARKSPRDSPRRPFVNITPDSPGMRGPRTMLGALLWGLVFRLALRVTGLRFRAREVRDVARVDHVRIEALYAVVLGLSMVHVVYGMGVQARHLFFALRKGDR